MLYKALSYTFTLALTLLTLLAVSPALTAQPHGQPIPHSEADLRLGTLTGRIVDEHGEGLIGATVRIIETGGGQVTDFDGNYSLQLAPGTYTVEIAYVGYETKQIQEVNITAGKETSLSVDLAIADNVLGTVVVTGSYKTSNTAGAMKIQQSMPQLSTVVSSEMIGKTADKNLGEALKRVTGVTTMSNKYVAVRGMGERWNEASLDGIPLPSTESNSKAFGFDLIPTSLIDNVTVLKTATPDVSGNFSGGLIQITTRDIPTKDFISISAGTSYNSLSTFQTQKYRIRGDWDWLGYDDGRRTLPKELHEIPFDPYNPVPELFEQSKRLTTDNFTIENFLFVLSEFSKLFLMRLNIHTHSVVMTTNTSKNHRCDINSQANVLYLSYNDSLGQLSAFPLTYCSIINCGNVSKGMAVNIGIPTRSTRTFHHFFKG